MMRTVGFLVVAPLLAACSGSNRVEGMVPGWANTPSSTVWAATPSPTAQATASKKRVEPAGKPNASPQEAKQPEAPGLPEE